MTLQKQTDGAAGIVVTRNFVEAEDIADALRRSGFADVVHCRDTRVALDMLGQRARSLAVAFLSFDGDDDQFEILLALLHEAGARTVVINGSAKLAETFGAAFLRRPFSDKDIDQCIAQVMAGK